RRPPLRLLQELDQDTFAPLRTRKKPPRPGLSAGRRRHCLALRITREPSTSLRRWRGEVMLRTSLSGAAYASAGDSIQEEIVQCSRATLMSLPERSDEAIQSAQVWIASLRSQ